MNIISIQKRINERETLCALLFFSLIFFFNPLLAILISTIFIINHKGQSEKMQYGLYAFIAIYFGLINTTKILESDLLSYKDYFEQASNMSLGKYMDLFKQEPVFYFFTYISNKVFFCNFKLYLIFTTFISYFLVFISIHKFWRIENKSVILFSVLIFAFYFTFLFGTAFLIRQILAESIFIYFFIEKIVNNKIKWFLIPIAIFIHSSSILLFAICFIPKLKEKVGFKNLVILVMITMVIVVFGSDIIQILNSYTMGINWLNYPFQMISRMDVLDNSWYDGKQARGIRIDYYIFFIFPILFSVFFKPKGSLMLSILNFCIIFIGILEVFVASNLKFMQLRMAYYLPMLIPFVWPDFFLNKKIFFLTVIRNIGMIIFLSFFIFIFIRAFYLSPSMHSKSKVDILFYPAFFYFLD